MTPPSTSPASRPARPRKRLSAEARRAQFFEVAAALVTEQGIDAVTMERVAEAAGVSRALLYGHFSNADELLAALFEREVGALDEQVFGRIAGITRPGDRLNGILEVVFKVVARKGPLLGRLFQRHRAGGALEAARQRRQAFVVDYFAAQIETELCVDAQRARVAAAVWQSAVNGALDLALKNEYPAPLVIEVFSAMILGGVQALTTGAAKGAGS